MCFEEERVITSFTVEFQFTHVVIDFEIIITATAKESRVVANAVGDSVSVALIHDFDLDTVINDGGGLEHAADQEIVVTRIEEITGTTIAVNINGRCGVVHDEGVISAASVGFDRLDGEVVIDPLEITHQGEVS